MEEEEIQKSLDNLKTELLAEIRNNHRRDLWDKLAGFSPVISGFLVMIGAIVCTYQYNQEMIKLQEASTVERFIPHLLEDEKSQKMAILALQDLVNTEVAAKYAEIFASDGTMSALNKIADTGSDKDRRIAQKALETTKKRLEQFQTFEREETKLIRLIAEKSADSSVPDQRVDLLIGDLADLYLDHGNNDAAIALLKLAIGDLIKYNPQDRHAKSMMSKLIKALKQKGRDKEAQKFLKHHR